MEIGENGKTGRSRNPGLFAGIREEIAGIRRFKLPWNKARSKLRSMKIATSSPPELSFAFEVCAKVGAAIDVGKTPRGHRKIVPITGGTLEGPGINGRIIPGGADWQIVRPDGVVELQARYAVEMDGGSLLYIENNGIRRAPPEIMARLSAGESLDESLYYFRTVPRFECASPDYAWLMESVFVGTGRRNPHDVQIRFWKVL